MEMEKILFRHNKPRLEIQISEEWHDFCAIEGVFYQPTKLAKLVGDSVIPLVYILCDDLKEEDGKKLSELITNEKKLLCRLKMFGKIMEDLPQLKPPIPVTDLYSRVASSPDDKSNADRYESDNLVDPIVVKWIVLTLHNQLC